MPLHRVMLLLLFSGICGETSVCAAAADPNPATLHSNRGAWPLYRQWNAAEARHFAVWVAHIYDRKTHGTREQRLAKLDRVFTDPEMNLLLDPGFAGDPSNPQVDMRAIQAMHRIVDCHKLVMSLAAYYSCRRGLPFMFSQVRSVDGADNRTANATIPVSTLSSLDYQDAYSLFIDATAGTNTGNLRVEPFAENSEWSDTCPVALTREHLIPGCLYYLDGHVLVLARVEPSGNLRFLDATTSPTRDLYTFNGMNVVSGITPKNSDDPVNPYAGCYRGFRVLRHPIAETDENGLVLRVRRRTDDEMREFGFSTEQHGKMEELIRTGRIVEGRHAFQALHQFVRYRMRGPTPFRVVDWVRRFADAESVWMAERETLVRQGWADVRENGPVAFPESGADTNIYTVGGRWGAWSSALGDTEFRERYFAFQEELDALLQYYAIDARFLDLDGLHYHAIWTVSELAWAILVEKNRVFMQASARIQDSKGIYRQLSLHEVEQRLFDLSFDPNHPPELRWGARPDSREAQDLPGSATPGHEGKTYDMRKAYLRQGYYRTLTHREIGDTPLSDMPEDEFPARQTMDIFLWNKWAGAASPPLVPHGGRAAYEARERRRGKR